MKKLKVDATSHLRSLLPVKTGAYSMSHARVTIVAKAVIAALAAAPSIAAAGPGFGETTNPMFANGRTATFYANSPSGLYPATACFDNFGNAASPSTGSLCDSGAAIRKFIDTLPGLGEPGMNNLGNYIPVASPDTRTYADADYFEIAVVEYRQRMHSDVHPTPGSGALLRGYVQIDAAATDAAAGLNNNAVSPSGSKGIPLSNPDGSAIRISRPDATSASGFRLVQAYAVDKPSYLGPAIVATKGRPTRLKFYNALPTGRAANGQRLGDLFLPVDETLPGSGFGPDGKVKFTQNRAAVHLHGGDTPWISDGTPHQWIAPASETDVSTPGSVAAEAITKKVSVTPYLRGASTVNVPDMPDPGPGATTYYFPNGQSARLLWYHDHTLGLTRVNVYAGMAAPYVLTDSQEQALTTGAGSLAGVPEIPLVIQDKTFAPANISRQDARWDTQLWGKAGDLWFPHVIETNQDPMSADGTNPVGRWDWGPFFWPVFPSAMDLPTGEHRIYAPGTRRSFTNTVTGQNLPGPSELGLTEVTTTPEAFMDTPLVNGVAYPAMEVEPRAYRFRILNAANDRMWNLGFYVAADANTVNPGDPLGNFTSAKLCDGTEGPEANCSEVRMVPFIGPNQPTSTTFVCGADGLTQQSPGFPLQFPCTGGLAGSGWGMQDNRPGGVPDPKSAGPSMWLIGNEGGFVPAPIEVPSTPINYEYNKRSVTLLNVMEHGIYLGNAERADVVVDFSRYAGKTLILYNDGPAPVPAADPRLDYYTGAGDQTAAGGAPNTLPGYGPNTRTVMKIKVRAGAPQPFDFAKLSSEVSAAYVATQNKPIVPQAAYSSAYPSMTADTFASIFTGSIYLNQYKGLTFTTPDTITYTPAPTGCNSAVTCQPKVDAAKAAGPVTAAAGTTVNAYVENKAIQELFDPTWGRMNATLGVELPFTSALTQTTIPLAYIDPATESVADGETQFWKITHNGVDTHPVHFHLVNVQVVNRVGWDGTIKPPQPEEIGWKETVKMNPLEDIVVAVRAKMPAVPFGLPHSYRPLDPTQALSTGAMPVTSGFTQVDPKTGAAATVSNIMADFKNEYVWHCHILGHEENDFMRPFVFNAKELAPPAFAATGSSMAGGILINWTDPTPVAGQPGQSATPAATYANRGNEIGFRVERAVVDSAGRVGSYTVLGRATTYTSLLPAAATGATPIVFKPTVNTLANAVSFTDDKLPPITPVTTPAAPANISATQAGSSSISVAWTYSGSVTGFFILRDGVQIASVASSVRSFMDNTATAGSHTYTVQAYNAGTLFSYRVAAVSAVGETYSQPIVVPASDAKTAGGIPVTIALAAAPSGLTADLASATGNNGFSLPSSVALTVLDPSSPPASIFVVETCVGICAASGTLSVSSRTNFASGFNTGTWYPVPATNVATTVGSGSTAGITVSGLTLSENPLNNGNRFNFRVRAGSGASPASNISTPIVLAPLSSVSSPTAVSATAGTARNASVNWSDAANNNNGYAVQQRTASRVTNVRVTNGGTGYTSAPSVTFSAPPTGGLAPVARATVSGGRVTGISVTTPGYGYINAPAVTISDPANGTRATGTATLTNAGAWSGATTIPATIPGNAKGATVSGLSTGTPYQFQVRANAAFGMQASPYIMAPAVIIAP